MIETFENWKAGQDYPQFMTEPALVTLKNGYLDENETPKMGMERVSRQVELELGIRGISEKVFYHLWEGNIGLSSPLWSNFGKQRGLPISCFGTYIKDSVVGFTEAYQEVCVESKNGGGTSAYFGNIRPLGSDISNTTAKARGVMSPVRMMNNAIEEISQGGVRRGMLAGYLDFSHPDIMDFLEIREIGNPIQTITSAVCISDEDVRNIVTGDEVALKTWAKVCEKRNNHGVPYILFTGNANNHKSTPIPYKGGNRIKASNLCSEIMNPSDKDESFVCCLASLNLANYESWKNTDAVEICVFMLDAVMSEFIRKSSNIKGMEKPLRFAKNHRSLGIGTFGEQTMLQRSMIPFGSLLHESNIRIIYSQIEKQSKEASSKLADMFGACPENKKVGVNMRNTTLLAIAPTTTNALIAGDVSAGIEPLISNLFQRKVAKGSFTKKNPELVKLLKSKEQNTSEVWRSIRDNFGSVQHLDFLDQDEKDVFKTAFEINQYAIIKMASIRQNYICQSQSLNLFILPNVSAKQRSEIYLTAYYYGIKSLYYQRSLSILKESKSVKDVKKYFNDVSISSMDSTCIACEG
jgi:ribonucleoside-diphosphate reductase alpha chain